MAKGAVWMVLFKLLERGIGLISTMILARMLVPHDFGLVAMALSIIAALELLYAFSFDVALIQKLEITNDHYNTAWSFNFSFGVFSALILYFIAPYAANFYSEERLELIIYLLAIGMLISAIENIGIVDFRKNMQFDKEFKWMISRKLVSFVVTVSLAFYLQSYWALIFGMLSGKLTGTVLSYTMHPYRPRLSFAAAKELFAFSVWLLINNLLFFLKLRSADFIIGRLSGSRDLGLFSVGYEISNLPTTELVAPINRAVFPGYANMSDNIKKLQQGFIDVLSVIYLFAVPIGVGIAVTANLLVPVFLGPKWVEIVPIIQILAFFGVASAVQTNIGSVFLALGKPRLLTMLAVLYVTVLIPSLLYTVETWGIVGAAWTYLAVSLLIIPITYHLGLKVLQLSWGAIWEIVWRPSVAAAIMFFCVYHYISLFDYNSDIYTSVIVLFSSAALGAILYVAMIVSFWMLSKKPKTAEYLVIQLVANKDIMIVSRVAQKLV